MKKTIIRCNWARQPLDIAYHDKEWGVPVHDDRLLFEFLVLEGAQAGLSWSIILAKREGYRKAFDNFDPLKVSRFSSARVERLMLDQGIVRNRLKIQAAVTNAKLVRAIQDEFGSLDRYLWDLAGGETKVNAWRTMYRVPAATPVSDRMSKELSSRGFKFVGSTICYAFMQAVGMVNDHLVTCFRYPNGSGNTARR
jgi:DNA-3-methyladenine glycosylase I